MNPYYQDELATIINGNQSEAEQYLFRDDVFWVVDPPWNGDMRIRWGINCLVFCDEICQQRVISELGAPQWIFIWDCVSSWFCRNRPLRNSKFAFWYGDILSYKQNASLDGSDTGGPRMVRNSRGQYLHTPAAGGKRLSDIYRYPITRLHRYGPSHEKPLPWVRMMISNCAPDKSLIVDPYCGTGTTIVAAKELGLRSVGIDIDSKQCGISAARLSQQILLR